jgi:formylglycine-generating enzyme required for sulfatase activity
MLQHAFTVALVVLLAIGSITVVAAEEPKDAGGKKQITNSIGMKLVLIPAGEFLMGTREGQGPSIGAWDNEKPQHRVRITRPFYLGVYDVTQAEYQRVTGDNPSCFSATGDGKKQVSDDDKEKARVPDTSRFPVEQVSWREAVEFCRKLSAIPGEKAAGRVYCLPTESQWEYACRAGSTTDYYYGNDMFLLDAYARYIVNAGGRTHAVGEKRANAWGLYDMHGNVMQWCQDWYGDHYYAHSPKEDPTGPTNGTQRSYRGGCFDAPPQNCRSASRFHYTPDARFNSLGFRVCVCLVLAEK